MKRLKEMGVFDKKIVIPFAILLLLVGATFWALRDAESINPIEEDGKQAKQEVEDRDKADRKEAKKELGVEYPTMEEIDRFKATIGLDENPFTILEKEYGEEVVSLYLGGELLSTYDDGEDKIIKEGRLKMMLDDNAVGSTLDISSGEDTFPVMKPYVSTTLGFQEEGDYRVGYVSTVPVHESSAIYGDDYLVYGFNISAYTLKELSAVEFQDGFEKINIKVNGIEARPGIVHMREAGKLGEIIGAEAEERVKDIRSLWLNGAWLEGGDFNKAVVYPGTVVSMYYEVNMKDIVPDIEVKEDLEIDGELEDLTLVVGNVEIPLSNNVEEHWYDVRK